MNTISLNNNLQSTVFQPMDLKKILLAEGECLNVEASAMLACKNVEMKTGLNGSIFSVAKRYFFGGESLFQNTYSAKNGGGWIALEEAVPGQINAYELQPGKTLTIGRGAYTASDQNVKISTNYAGITGWWKGVGFAKLNAMITDERSGRIFFNSTNGIVKVIKISNDEGPVIIDNNNIVAYTSDLEVSIRKMGGLKSLLFSGEGTVNEFKGNGLVFVGSGEGAARENFLETITKAVVQALLPDPVTLINRITMLGLVYIVAYSPHIKLLANAIEDASQSFANAKCCKG